MNIEDKHIVQKDVKILPSDSLKNEEVDNTVHQWDRLTEQQQQAVLEKLSDIPFQ
ncbi:hypothetical protein [Aliivibrio fischeri]|uniref:hypothetical protein n=1 Tax=Aliivibrio fischeri TaxID=668 RepID=UPI00159F2CE0|nr:hypothetical protein [Aliivibrio fischeri]